MKNIEIQGYRRPDGKLGIRNYILVIPTVSCAYRAAEMIREGAPFVSLVNNQTSCSEMGENRKLSFNTLVNIGRNPNVFGVIIIGVGCEGITGEALAAEIKKSGKRVGVIDLQDNGGTANTAKKGIELANEFLRESESLKKDKGFINEIMVGVECGATDAFAAVSANPAIGEFVDEFIEVGGTVIISETIELMHSNGGILKRIRNKEDKDKWQQV